MSGKFEKKRKKKKFPLGAVIAIVVVLALIIGVGILRSGDEEKTNAPTSSGRNEKDSTLAGDSADKRVKEIELGEGLYITRIDSYTGIYMEDGSDEAVTGLMMIMLENRSEKALQLARLSVEFPEGTAVFSATSLPAGERAVLLDEGRMNFTESEPVKVTVETVVMADSMDLHTDKFEISGLDGALNVRNISNVDFSGDIYIYYKNYAHNTYYGGITYRAKVEGGLDSGEVRQVMTQHYDEDGSKILMVTYTG